MIAALILTLGFFRRFTNFHRSPAPFIPSEIKTVLRGDEAVGYPPVAGEKLVLIEGVDILENDKLFMSLATRPDVLSVLRSQGNRLGA